MGQGYAGESEDLDRKKVLLSLLARREAYRLGLRVTTEELQSELDGFRLRHHLADPATMAAWLRESGLTEREFAIVLRDFVLTRDLERLYAVDIAAAYPAHARVNQAQRLWLRGPRGAQQSAAWLQLNVALTRCDGDALPSARALFACLDPILAAWCDDGRLDAYFFARKAPDVRLRFLAHDPLTMLQPTLEAALAGLVADGIVARFFPSVYEPEESLFGGAAATAHVHGHFTADTRAWTAHDRLVRSGSAVVPPATLLVSVLDDLFRRTVSCPTEIWDVWHRVATLAGRPDSLTVPDAECWSMPALLRRAGSEDERRVHRMYARANHDLASGLHAVWASGELEAGLRGVLAFVAVFTANRHGLGPALAVLADAMVQALDPHDDPAEDIACRR
ncbi:thiopeptide-type bacteriocin biosynthesis protein [Streptomyces canus]|uniref:thiopeptide-type bacteriocin biosynthesis protein n=1 Tax=Streptomyces canus TaxID=58343 RepID=UPI002E2CC16E|nr:thiopeptide-type bacteriocin biosynthesis protein [Streptomyces canus]